ncbi:hypothetical protein SK128_028562, partial [Halocaridina rubra]
MANEWQTEVCRVGEETLESILSFWESVPSDLQNNLLEYLHLQILIHHPQRDGAFLEGSTYVHNNENWQRGLYHLYQLITQYVQMISSGKKFAMRVPSDDHQMIPHVLVQLAARLCHKIFQDSSACGVVDITQFNIPSTSTQGGRSNKRRKIEIGLEYLVTMLREDGSSPNAIVWYQILHELLVSHRSFFSRDRCGLMLDLFTYILSTCTVISVQHHILRCLEALAHQYNIVYPECNTKEDLRYGKWLAVWDITLRLISGKQCSRIGLKLVRTLVHLSLVIPDTSIFKLFYQGMNFDEEALATLKLLLCTVPLPSTFRIDSVVFSRSQHSDSRKSLLQAVLPSNPEGPLTSLESPYLLGQVLLILRHRDSRHSLDEIQLALNCEVSNFDESLYPLQKLEELLIFSSIASNIPKHQHLYTKECKTLAAKELRILPIIQEEIVDWVSCITQQ